MDVGSSDGAEEGFDPILCSLLLLLLLSFPPSGLYNTYLEEFCSLKLQIYVYSRLILVFFSY